MAEPDWLPFIPGVEITAFSLRSANGADPDWLTMDVGITVEEYRDGLPIGTLSLSKAYATESRQWHSFPMAVLQLTKDRPLIDPAKLDDERLWSRLTDDEKQAVAEVVAFFDDEPERFLAELGDASDDEARSSLARKAAIGAAAVGAVATVVGISWRAVRSRRSGA